MPESIKASIDLPRDLHARLKELAKRSRVSLGQYSEAVLKRAADRGECVVVAFPQTEDLPAAANFSDRSEEPEIDD